MDPLDYIGNADNRWIQVKGTEFGLHTDLD
jgi:hypothetical protein